MIDDCIKIVCPGCQHFIFASDINKLLTRTKPNPNLSIQLYKKVVLDYRTHDDNSVKAISERLNTTSFKVSRCLDIFLKGANMI